jgi:hypothetical protein
MSFVFTNKQVEFFDAVINEKFHRKILAIIRDCFKNKTDSMPDEKLLKRIKEDHMTANKFDMKTERGIARFICLGFMLEQKFYTRPEFIELFNYKNVDKEECVDLIFEDADRLSNNRRQITSSLPQSNRNYNFILLIQNIALSIQ